MRIGIYYYGSAYKTLQARPSGDGKEVPEKHFMLKTDSHKTNSCPHFPCQKNSKRKPSGATGVE
jgi:hypothetical protein